jgi:hypothetical protein
MKTKRNNERSYTALEQRSAPLGKPFVKGDPRINRKGRPRAFDELRALAVQIAHETIPGEQTITTIDAILRQWAASREPVLQQAFVAYAFGKVPDKLETNPFENKTTIVVRHAHEVGTKTSIENGSVKEADDGPNVFLSKAVFESRPKYLAEPEQETEAKPILD